MTEKEIFQECVRLGMTQAGAAGCTANILHESSGRPDNVEDRCPVSDAEYTRGVDDGSYADFVTDRYGYGLCQWTLPSRKEALLRYAREHGVSISDADMQFQFLAREMRKDYAYVWSILTTTASPYTAGYEMCKRFERPQNIEASSVARGEKAKEIYERCKETGGKTVGYDKQKLIDWGYSQLGYHEKASNSQLDDFTANAGDQNWTKYAAYLDALGDFYNGPKNGPYGLWCDIWYDCGMVQCYGRAAAQFLLCQPDKSCGAGCSFSAAYYNAKGQFYKTGPQTGDQIFFGSSWQNIWHTGLVVEVGGGYVTTIEGNSSDQVQKCRYAVNDSRIWGYGRPAWNANGPAATDDAQTPADGGNEEIPDPIEVPDTGSAQRMCSPRLPMLRKGDTGGAVYALQRQLLAMGLPCGCDKNWRGEETPDGDFGPTTEKSVMKLQGINDLAEDGIVGAETWPAVLGV